MPMHPFRCTQPVLRFSINGNVDFDIVVINGVEHRVL